MSDSLYHSLRKDIQGDVQSIRKEMHEIRTLLTEIRISISAFAKAQDVIELDRRVNGLEHHVRQLQEQVVSHRDYQRWLVPVAISLVSTAAVLGLKIWEMIGH